MNLYGPSHSFYFVLHTNTGSPAGKSLKYVDLFRLFGPDGYQRPNAILFSACYFSASIITASIACARSNCDGTGTDLAGLDIDPNTKSIGNRPSGSVL